MMQRGFRSQERVSRRRILQAGAVLAAPWVVPSRVFGGDGLPPANDRVHIGLIGAGIRAQHLTADMPPDGRIVAVCDCFAPRVQQLLRPDPASNATVSLQEFATGDAQQCASYVDYRQMIDEARLDAVVVAVPDHHHAQAAMLACHAGLDVYCEKPLTLTIGEGKKLVEAVRRTGRVLQVGSQQRSMEMDRFACEFVRSGGIGNVSRVEVMNWPGPLPYEDLPEEPVPGGMHWDLFCGPRPLRPYNWRLWQKDERQWQGRRWRGWDMWRDYSGHLMTNWGAHAIDIVQWALGKDDTGPVEVEPLVDGYTGAMRECPVVARYADGTELEITHAKGFYAGGNFHGELGRMVISRNRFTPFPRTLVPDPPSPDVAAIWDKQGFLARPHLQNWLDCIRTRQEPVAPVEVGHRSVTICHLAGIARELRRKLRWDPQEETFPDDAEARSLIDRPRRTGWELPETT